MLKFVCVSINVRASNRMFVYLDGVGEPGAEGVKDAEAVVQPERLSVLTEEVDQFAAFLLQLLPTPTQRAQRRGRRLRERNKRRK